MLANRIEKSYQESQDQLEAERKKRLENILELANEKSLLNQQLLEAQEIAEHRLEQEKDALLLVIRKMKQERRLYEEHIRRSEEEIRAEAGVLRMQRAEMEEKIKRLEQERSEISSRWQTNQLQSQEAAETSPLQKDLLETLQRVEQEKNALTAMLKEAELKAQQHTVALVTNLEEDKRKIADIMRRMEDEKAAQAQKVLVTKKSTVNIALAISQ